MSSRLFTSEKFIAAGVFLLFWVPVIFCSLLLVVNTIPYFSFNPDMPFLTERAVLYHKLVWRTSFYVHIAAGGFCILTALLQFSSWILKKRKKIHVVAGKIYVFVVLLLGAPSGFYMTFFAEGGIPERICFMAMAVLWFYSTFRGFRAAAIDKNFKAHKYWMIRSYAMALTAVTFRIYHLGFFYFFRDMSHFENYSVSLWISVVGNALVAELVVYLQAKNYIKTLTA